MYQHVKFEDGTEGYIQCEGVLGVGIGIFVLINIICAIKSKYDESKAKDLVKKLDPSLVSELNRFLSDWKKDVEDLSTDYTAQTKRKFKEFVGSVDINMQPSPIKPEHIVKFMSRNSNSDYTKSDTDWNLLECDIRFDSLMESKYDWASDEDSRIYDDIKDWLDIEIRKTIKTGLKLKRSGIIIKLTNDGDTTYDSAFCRLSVSYIIDIDMGHRWDQIFNKLKSEVETADKNK